MTIKYRVHEVAKDFDMKSKDIIKLLGQYFEEPKKHQTALEEEELDVIFDTLTQQHQVESFDEYFAAALQKKSEEKAEPEKAEPVIVEDGKAEKAPAAAEPKAAEKKSAGEKPSAPKQTQRQFSSIRLRKRQILRRPTMWLFRPAQRATSAPWTQNSPCSA